VRFAVVLVAAIVVSGGCGTATIGGPPDEQPDAHVNAPPPDASAPAPDARVCDAGDANIYDPQTGHCLSYFTAVATWLEARNLCIARGGDLLVPNSAHENDLNWPLAPDVVNFPDSWLGGTDAASEGTFVWVTGEPMTYTHFRSGEPNNGGTSGTQEDCMVSEDDTLGTWDDRPCDRDYPYTCEIP
jgi:hypothetical protein